MEEDKKKEVVIQKKLTNRLKRTLNKTKQNQDNYIINTRKLMMTLFNLNIANGNDLHEMFNQEKLIRHKHTKELEKLMCIRKTRRYGRKFHTWIEGSDEQVCKERDKRYRKLESQAREMFYRGLTETKLDT